MNKDTKIKKYRINRFEQENRFWEIVNENTDFSNSEMCLYFFLMYVNNRLAWREWFSIAISEALGGARLSEKTYYKALNRLESLQLIERRKGVKNRACQIKIIVLKAVKITVDTAVDTTVDPTVDPTVNVPTFIDSKDSKDNKESESEKTHTASIFNNKKIETPEQFKELFSNEIFIDNWCKVKQADRKLFVEFLNRWVTNKELCGGYKYPKENLIGYMLSDWDKESSKARLEKAPVTVESFKAKYAKRNH